MKNCAMTLIAPVHTSKPRLKAFGCLLLFAERNQFPINFPGRPRLPCVFLLLFSQSMLLQQRINLISSPQMMINFAILGLSYSSEFN